MSFLTTLCAMANEAKRVLAKEAEVEGKEAEVEGKFRAV